MPIPNTIVDQQMRQIGNTVLSALSGHRICLSWIMKRMWTWPQVAGHTNGLLNRNETTTASFQGSMRVAPIYRPDCRIHVSQSTRSGLPIGSIRRMNVHQFQRLGQDMSASSIPIELQASLELQELLMPISIS